MSNYGIIVYNFHSVTIVYNFHSVTGSTFGSVAAISGFFLTRDL